MWQRSVTSNDVLIHHGILGMKWGIRRYQNEDGTLTNAGKKRYQADSVDSINTAKGIKRRLNDVDQAMAFHKRTRRESEKTITKNESKGRVGDEYNGVAKKSLSEAQDWINKGEKETSQLLKKANLRDMMVTSTDAYRSTARGKQKALAYGLAFGVGGVIGGTAGGSVYMYKAEKGTKYKVKERNKA